MFTDGRQFFGRSALCISEHPPSPGRRHKEHHFLKYFYFFSRDVLIDKEL